mgnify:CR=1 FL=1
MIDQNLNIISTEYNANSVEVEYTTVSRTVERTKIKMKKVFNKLVRDKIPEIIEENDEYSLIRTLNDKEYEKALYDKLLEEANEVINANKKEETEDGGEPEGSNA